MDFGEKRVGLAVSDETGSVVVPVGAFLRKSDAQAAAVVAEAAREREVERVVVGLPVHLSGEEGSQAALARTFTDELQALLDIPVDTYDERLTSRMADASRRAGSKAARDSLAAAHLLDDYLVSLARQGES